MVTVFWPLEDLSQICMLYFVPGINSSLIIKPKGGPLRMPKLPSTHRHRYISGYHFHITEGKRKDSLQYNTIKTLAVNKC